MQPKCPIASAFKILPAQSRVCRIKIKVITAVLCMPSKKLDLHSHAGHEKYNITLSTNRYGISGIVTHILDGHN